MKNFLSAIFLFLMSCCAFAATKEMESAAGAPVDTVDMIYVVIFVIIFVGSIAGFFVYLWWSDRNKKPDQ